MMDLNIYQKIFHVKQHMENANLQKSGKNHFGGFNYYELEDLIPELHKAYERYGLDHHFNIRSDIAIMNIINLDKPEEFAEVSIFVPALEKAGGKMNTMQSLGAYTTYLKRYLITAAYDIGEYDQVDHDPSSSKEPIKSGTFEFNTQKNNVDMGKGEDMANAISNILKEEGKSISQEEIWKKAVELRKNKVAGYNNLKHLTAYFKENEVKA